MTDSASIRSLAIAALLCLGSHASGQAVTLLPQEQAIANFMISDPDQGRPTLILDPIIEAVARARAKDMAVRNYFSHVNPDGVAANYLLRQAGYQLPSWWGTDPTLNYVESIAAGYASASDTWTQWMNSPPHKEHLLAQNSFFASETHYGVGYYYDPDSTYRYYWVVITAPPQPLAFTTPSPGQVVTTPAIAIAGTTDPGTSPASVRFRVENSGATGAYEPATGVTTWSGTATGLAPGQNTIRAQSLDGSGNVIDENTCTINYRVEGTLTVSVSGSGSVTPAYAGVTTQAVGQPVTITARPAAGSIFTGWSGSITSGSASLTFTMSNGLDLQANFAPNPFIAASGAYYGIVTTGSGAQSGMLRLTLGTGGLFTGRLMLSGSSFSFSGHLDSNGDATVTIPLPDRESMTLSLEASLDGGGQITGTLSAGSLVFTLSQSTFNFTTNTAPQAGRYTMALPPDPTLSGSSAPRGDGYATIAIAANGAATLAGRLADGTPFSTTGQVANDGTLALDFVPSGASPGSRVNGLLTFHSTDDADLEGSLAWTKGPHPADAFYPAGFTAKIPAISTRFAPSPAGFDALALPPGAATAALGDGNLPQPLSPIPVTINRADQAAMVTPGAPHLTFSINPLSGLLTGSFAMPQGDLHPAVRGVVLQKQNAAFGFFRGVNQCGSFSLTAP